jgi:hypothetical protein
LLFRQRKNVLRGLLELCFLIVIDVRPLAFGEPVHEKGPVSTPEKDDSPVALGLSLPGPSDPLLDNLTAKVGVDLTLFGPNNRLTQSDISNPFLPGEALKPPGFEELHKWTFFIL